MWPPLLAKTALILLSIDLANLEQNSGDILFTQISLTLWMSSSLLEQEKSSRQSFMKVHAFSIGFKSEELPGQGMRGMPEPSRKVLMDLAVWQGAPSCRY